MLKFITLGDLVPVVSHMDSVSGPSVQRKNLLSECWRCVVENRIHGDLLPAIGVRKHLKASGSPCRAVIKTF